MIKIIKDGKLQKETKTIYNYVCKMCGCEFEFEKEDCVASGDFIKVDCPCCKANIHIRLARLEKYKKEIE